MSILNLIGGLFGARKDRSIYQEIRELIKGKEEDPQRIIELTNSVNEAEAMHRSIFVAGWRPAIGWTGAIVIFYHFVLQPIGVWVLHLNGITEVPPSLDLDSLWPVITGMLGIGAMRTIDKTNNKTR